MAKAKKSAESPALIAKRAELDHWTDHLKNQGLTDQEIADNKHVYKEVINTLNKEIEDLEKGPAQVADEE